MSSEDCSHLKTEVAARGFALVPGFLEGEWLDRILDVVMTGPAPGTRRRASLTYAIRNLLSQRAGLGEALRDGGLDRLACDMSDGPVVPADATFFDKNTATNWKVPAHQDLMMPAEATSPGADSVQRYGASYAEPPSERLGLHVALRIHFDDCAEDNGAIHVVPGSHRRGKLGDDAIGRIGRDEFVCCPARRGDVLVVKPLLVHRSSAAADPKHRRVLHVVYRPEARR